MKINDWALEKIILDIENSDFQKIEQKYENETFELWSDPILLKDLSGNIGALFVRALLSKLNVNEHHVFRWRLENKYRQYQILNHYVPGCVVETINFSQILNTDNGAQKIRELCENGFFIKATLGHRTGDANSFDKTKELDSIIDSYQREHNHLEKWMLQKRLDLKAEFRIHTFNKDLIYGLTFIQGLDSSNRLDAEEFVKGILEKLPDTILQGTLIGWDIGITNSNEFYVIETNLTGFHPELGRGFQTSGYFGDRTYGSLLCAWLNNYFRIKYKISIDSVDHSLLSSDQFYKDFMYYVSIFKNERMASPKIKTGDTVVSAIMYLGEDIDPFSIRLLGYFEMENFADIYYVIINEKNISAANDLFSEDVQIKILTEDTLFTEDQYTLIKQLSYERRKKISSYHALRIVEEGSYFII